MYYGHTFGEVDRSKVYNLYRYRFRGVSEPLLRTHSWPKIIVANVDTFLQELNLEYGGSWFLDETYQPTEKFLLVEVILTRLLGNVSETIPKRYFPSL